MNRSPGASVPPGVQPIDLETPPPAPTRRGPRTVVRAFLARPAVSRTLTALAGAVLFAALIFPNVLSRLSPAGFLRIPLEGAVLLVLLLVLPPLGRRVVAVPVGVLLGWLVIEKCLDMGFFAELNRPFDPVLDWVLLDDAYGFASEAYGRPAATGLVVAIVALVLALLTLIIWSVLRIGALAGRHRRRSAYTAAGIAAAWALTFSLGASLTGAVPVAARSTVTYAWDRAGQARAGLRDEAAFADEVRADAFKSTPPDKMLTALRGKDVVFTFVESYGRSAIEHPALAPIVDPVLDSSTKELAAAGYAARSGWLTSPTFGGGSWLAHSTFESGVWINNEKRYRNLVAGDRLTLTSAFRKTGDFRTVSVMPGTTRAWPEGAFYGYDAVWDSRNLGYRGPKFSWSPMPDQYTLKQLNAIEYKKPGRGPLMIEMPLVSSHTPWAPIPEYLPDWSQVGDGSIYAGMVKEGEKQALWAEPRKVRPAYGRSIVYSVTSLVNWVKQYGDDNLVLVFLGDHQPSPIAAGANASHDVPISIVAKDPKVLERIDGWGWADGLRPAPATPVWPMSDFRDRFLTAFGSTPATSAP